MLWLWISMLCWSQPIYLTIIWWFCVYVSATKWAQMIFLLSSLSSAYICFLSFLLVFAIHGRTRARVHTPLVKKGSTRCCSSTHISTQSFIHSFIQSFSLAFSIFIPLWHTHTRAHTASIRRNRLFSVALPPPSSSRLPYLCSLFRFGFVCHKSDTTSKKSTKHS